MRKKVTRLSSSNVPLIGSAAAAWEIAMAVPDFATIPVEVSSEP